MSWFLNEKVWRSKLWPRTERTKIFIGDAVMTAGQAMFSEWDGREGDVVPNLNRVTTDSLRIYARDAIREGEDPEEFRLANARRETRLRRVISWIVVGALNGDYATFLRLPEGGDHLRVEPAVWNTDDEFKIFSDTRMRYCVPDPSYFETDWDAYVFFDRTAFELEVGKLGNAPLKVSESDLDALPTPLRIAVRLALDHPGIAKMPRGKRDNLARIAWRNAYPGADTESETHIPAIVSVLSEPKIDVIRKQKEAARLRKRSD